MNNFYSEKHDLHDFTMMQHIKYNELITEVIYVLIESLCHGSDLDFTWKSIY